MSSPARDKSGSRSSGDWYDLLAELSDVGRQASLLSLPEVELRPDDTSSVYMSGSPPIPPKKCAATRHKDTVSGPHCSVSSHGSTTASSDCELSSLQLPPTPGTPPLVHSAQRHVASLSPLPSPSHLLPSSSSSSIPVTPVTPTTPIPLALYDSAASTRKHKGTMKSTTASPPPTHPVATVSSLRASIVYPSRAAPPPPEFATLVLTGGDRLQISGFTPLCDDIVRRALHAGWHSVESQRPPGHGSAEWKLAGKPWLCADSSHSPHRLLARVFSALAEAGWRAALSGSGGGIPRVSGVSGLSRAFFFQRAPPRERPFFSVLLCDGSATLVDAPNERVRDAFAKSAKSWPGENLPHCEDQLCSDAEPGVITLPLGTLSPKARVGDIEGPNWPGDVGGARRGSATAIAQAHAFGILGIAFLQHFGTAGFDCVATYDVYSPPRKGWTWTDARSGGNNGGPAVDVWLFAQR